MPSFFAWRQVVDKAKGLLVSPEAIQLLEIWESLGKGSVPPGRDALRPERFPALLPDIWLMDYLSESRELRYRLEGAHIRARYDESLIGKTLKDIVQPDALEKVERYFLACVERPAICMVVGRLYHEWRQPGYGERVLLPLFSADGTAEGLIGITICKETFSGRALAEERAKRLTCILPLDGAEPDEEAE